MARKGVLDRLLLEIEQVSHCCTASSWRKSSDKGKTKNKHCGIVKIQTLIACTFIYIYIYIHTHIYIHKYIVYVAI